MKARLLAAAKYVVYPTFYFFCLFGFLYLTFPWDQVKERIESEFAKNQAAKGKRAWRLSIGSLEGYWLSGVLLEDTHIILPADDETEKLPASSSRLGKSSSSKLAAASSTDDKSSSASGADKSDKSDKEVKKARPSEIVIDRAHARVRLLPLLIGRVRLDFQADVFGGSASGVIPFGGGDLAIELENVDVAQIAPLRDTVGVPMRGLASGRLELSAPNGKWSKSAGTLNFTVTDMEMGDGKAKFRDLMTLPPAKIGTFQITATADSGLLKIEKFGAEGADVELAGEGTIKLKEPWDSSISDFWLRFGFSEAYKHKDDRTQALFVDDGPFPALISQDRKLKRAKRPDGLWGFHVHGKLARLKYDPTAADGKAKSSGTTKAIDPKKKSDDDDDEDAPTPKTPKTSERIRPVGKKALEAAGSPAKDMPALPRPTPEAKKQDEQADPPPKAEPEPEPEPEPSPEPPPSEEAPSE